MHPHGNTPSDSCRVCDYCGKPLINRSPKAHFCNVGCSNKNRARPVTLTCQVCEKVFNVNPARAKAKFCSPACKHKSLVTSVTLTCANCQKPFQAEPGRIAKGHKFCSKQCGYACQPSIPPDQRFWAKVQKTDNCWLWTASTDQRGYGTFGVTSDKIIKTHRYSYELHYGPIPKNMEVCHQCDNPSCVRPDHLFLGTHADNMTDMANKKRSARGEQSPISKLTNAQVIEIRQQFIAGNITKASLARAYNVHPETINAIVSGKTWRHLL